MSITTILPPARELSLSGVMQDVLASLRRQPMVPLDLRVVADNLAGVTVFDVERAVMKLEGPIRKSGEEAYVHFCRLNNQAVYIP